jgi:hypothetical protein
MFCKSLFGARGIGNRPQRHVNYTRQAGRTMSGHDALQYSAAHHIAPFPPKSPCNRWHGFCLFTHNGSMAIT